MARRRYGNTYPTYLDCKGAHHHVQNRLVVLFDAAHPVPFVWRRKHPVRQSVNQLLSVQGRRLSCAYSWREVRGSKGSHCLQAPPHRVSAPNPRYSLPSHQRQPHHRPRRRLIHQSNANNDRLVRRHPRRQRPPVDCQGHLPPRGNHGYMGQSKPRGRHLRPQCGVLSIRGHTYHPDGQHRLEQRRLCSRRNHTEQAKPMVRPHTQLRGRLLLHGVACRAKDTQWSKEQLGNLQDKGRGWYIIHRQR